MAIRLSIGCGQTPINGWRNFDNSMGILFSRVPYLPELMRKLGIINDPQYRFMALARENQIEYGDATKVLPVSDNCAEVVYSCHMLEHLDSDGAGRFLEEALRILRPGGIIRIAVPDIRKHVQEYQKHGDADAFIKATHLCVPCPKSIGERVRFLLFGPRHHQWLYDGSSLTTLVEKHGFTDSKVMPPGQTSILNHEPLDLFQRASKSVYVEAAKPSI